MQPEYTDIGDGEGAILHIPGLKSVAASLVNEQLYILGQLQYGFVLNIPNYGNQQFSGYIHSHTDIQLILDDKGVLITIRIGLGGYPEPCLNRLHDKRQIGQPGHFGCLFRGGDKRRQVRNIDFHGLCVVGNRSHAGCHSICDQLAPGGKFNFLLRHNRCLNASLLDGYRGCFLLIDQSQDVLLDDPPLRSAARFYFRKIYGFHLCKSLGDRRNLARSCGRGLRSGRFR